MDLTTTRLSADDSQTIRVLLVDDHILLAETISAFVSSHSDIEITSTQTLEDALAIISSKGTFDVVLLDYNLPGTEGISGLTKMIEVNGKGVALFSGVASRPIVERALEVGAAGFIPKTIGVKSLVNAIRFIAMGELYLPSDFVTKPHSASERQGRLKPIEHKVLMHLCEGLQNKEIARLLDLTEVSVKMHVKSICGKFGVKNRTQAVLVAQKESIC